MALPYFVDWLIENVHLVEITAYCDEDAYTIFETMNDRGLSLTPADMLKGYLLANVTDPDARLRTGQTWKERTNALLELGKDEDADGIKAWLRSQYAETIREHNFTLQYGVLLAPLQVTDSEEIVLQKLRVTATYLDILIFRRIWNYRAIDYSTMQYAMFQLMRDIRGRPQEELGAVLRARLDAESETFASNDGFRLHGTNGRQLHRLLARMSDFTETGSGMPSHYVDYAKHGGKSAYEIEHVWANHPELHTDEFSHPSEFAEYRNRLGDLVLLPKSFNASYGDLPYEQKRVHYDSQNLLVRSLHENAYVHNPGFLQFMGQSGLPFKPHSTFRKTDIDERQRLYRALAERIWNPARLESGSHRGQDA